MFVLAYACPDTTLGSGVVAAPGNDTMTELQRCIPFFMEICVQTNAPKYFAGMLGYCICFDTHFRRLFPPFSRHVPRLAIACLSARACGLSCLTCRLTANPIAVCCAGGCDKAAPTPISASRACSL